VIKVVKDCDKPMKKVLKIKDCDKNNDHPDQEKLDMKLRKKMAVKAEKEEENLEAPSSSVENKLEMVIEHHSEIGKVLQGIKEELKKPPCKPDTRGWDNIVEFFSEPVKGGMRAEKTLKFMGMLSQMTPDST